MSRIPIFDIFIQMTSEVLYFGLIVKLDSSKFNTLQNQYPVLLLFGWKFKGWRKSEELCEVKPILIGAIIFPT